MGDVGFNGTSTSNPPPDTMAATTIVPGSAVPNSIAPNATIPNAAVPIQDKEAVKSLFELVNVETIAQMLRDITPKATASMPKKSIYEKRMMKM